MPVGRTSLGLMTLRKRGLHWPLISTVQNGCNDVEFWASLGTNFIIVRKTCTLEAEISVNLVRGLALTKTLRVFWLMYL